MEDLSGSLATEESEDWFEPSGPPSTSAGMRMGNSSPDRIGGDEDDDVVDDDDEDDVIMDDAMSGGGRMRLAVRGRHSLRGAALRRMGRSRSGRAGMKKVNRDPQYLYIQMEYCPKKTLRNVIDEGKLGMPLPPILPFPSPIPLYLPLSSFPLFTFRYFPSLTRGVQMEYCNSEKCNRGGQNEYGLPPHLLLFLPSLSPSFLLFSRSIPQYSMLIFIFF